jgi:hypothetical protein
MPLVSRLFRKTGFTMEVEGIGRNVYLADNGDGKLINIGGTTYLVQDADALAKIARESAAARNFPRRSRRPCRQWWSVSW